MRVRIIALVAAIVAATSGGPAFSAGPRTAAGQPVPSSDFNGDGYGDLAVGTPEADETGKFSGGCVVVTYGSASGVSARRSIVLSQNSPGIPGAGERGDQFGESLTGGDLDADGYADLVVGSPLETVDGIDRAGMVTVIWGGPMGLNSGGTALLSPAPASGEQFGAALAVADVDGDGQANLVVVANERVRYYGDGLDRVTPVPPIDATGGFGGTEVLVDEAVAGNFTGTGSAGLVVGGRDRSDPGRRWLGYYVGGPGGLAFHGDLTAGAPGTGGIATAGDIDNDGYSDLITGTPETGPDGAGSITIRYGSPGGPGEGSRAPITFSADSAGVPGVAEAGDHFGASVAAGDVTGDGYADLAVGVPDEDIGRHRNVGGVVVLRGSARGMTTVDAQTIHQDTAGVPGVPEAGDRFGSAVRFTDVNADNRADLAISAAGEDVTPRGSHDGAVWLLRGSATGVTSMNASSFSAPTFGLTFVDRRFGSVQSD